MINLRKNNYSIFKTIFIILIFVSFNLFAKEEKFKSSGALFYETPTRFIIIIDIRKLPSIDSDNVTYYEINKQTGKSLKLKGETINIGPALNFRGYDFDYKNLSYIIYLQSNPALEIIKGKDKLILHEPIIEYNMDFPD